MRYSYTFILLLSLNISSDNLYYFEDEYDENRFNNLIKLFSFDICIIERVMPEK